MRMVDLIHKKRQGNALSKDEIDFIISGYTNGEIPDYQVAALLMAIYFKGMDSRETAELTLAMARSGDMADLSGIEGIKVDKHSTGGVGDKVSLIVAPLVAAAGVPVAKMSGRGLGHTGGTVDKLESIEGFNIELSREQFVQNVNRYKIAIAGQSANLAPADKKLYALRDVTDTVDSIPLIASSIMSKKLASGADAIVLDVKVGSGAFMKTEAEARKLAGAMVDIGKSLNKKTVAVLSSMEQPLGREVGNAGEVREAIEVLKGRGPGDLKTVSMTVASHMAVLGGIYKDIDTAFPELEKIILSGRALDKFKEFITAQGGNAAAIESPELLPGSRHHIEVKALEGGYIGSINAELVGLAAMLLGAGRKKKDDSIDYAAGISLSEKVGQRVEKGDTLCVLHSNLENNKAAEDTVRSAFLIMGQPPVIKELIYGVVS